MPERLKRFHQSEQSHFITFSCYHRRRCFKRREQPYLRNRPRKGPAEVRPPHICLRSHAGACSLATKRARARLTLRALKSLKQGVSRRLLDQTAHFWQKRYYDVNVSSANQFSEKLHYIHRNPVKRGLCKQPEDWEWSSFRHYATGMKGRIEIESEWTATKREQNAAGRIPASPSHSSQQKA